MTVPSVREIEMLELGCLERVKRLGDEWSQRYVRFQLDTIQPLWDRAYRALGGPDEYLGPKETPEDPLEYEAEMARLAAHLRGEVTPKTAKPVNQPVYEQAVREIASLYKRFLEDLNEAAA